MGTNQTTGNARNGRNLGAACKLFLVALAVLAGTNVAHARTPVRGYADLHAHWFSHLVNGGIWRDNNYAGVYCGYDVIQSNVPLAQQAQCALAGSGYPHLYDHPKFDKSTDQKAFYDWIKRAWRYGQRLAVVMSNYSDAACTNPISGAHRHIAGRFCNADYQIGWQARQAKSFVRWVQQNDPDNWVDIAYSPAEARSIMQSGKLAIILGAEVDDLFQCGKNVCTSAEVTKKLNRLEAIGIRHIFPIHGINNGFGGGGFFKEAYGLFQWMYQGQANWFGLRQCTTSGTSFKLWGIEGFGETNIGTHNSDAHFGSWLKTYYPLLPHFPEWSWPTHCNALGLTSLGEHLVETMMRLGLIIDVDHMSDLAFDTVHGKAMDLSLQTSLGRSGPYPLVASHISFRELLPDRSPDFSYMHTGHRNSNLAGEAHRNQSQVGKILQTNGMIAPILTQRAVRDYTGSRTAPDNNCMDSSRSWAQVYLTALDWMNGANVGLATDVNGAAAMPGPRFGKDACGDWKADGAHVTSEKAAQNKSPRLTYGNTFQTLDGMQLNRETTGNRTFDLNTDGVAHYGMVPDMLADLETLGMTQADLNVVWRSAEAYVDLWERAQPSFNFRPTVANISYRGISQSAPAAFAGSTNCPAGGGSIGQNARWWEFTIQVADVTGFAPGSTVEVSDYPIMEGCIIDGDLASGARVAIPIAPKPPNLLAAYDDDEWEIRVTDSSTGTTLTKSIRLEVPRPSITIAALGGAVMESGTCPAHTPEEEPGSERDLLAKAVFQPSPKKMRHDLEAQVTSQSGDFVPSTYNWNAESPIQNLGNAQTTSIEFCPCASRFVSVDVEETAGIETATVGFVLDAPGLSLDVTPTHIDQYGSVIFDPAKAPEGAATIELSVHAQQTSGSTLACTWPQLYWADAASTDPATDEVPLPASRFQAHGDGCQATITIWDRFTDGGAVPWNKRIRGVVLMEDGVQCGKQLFTIDTTPAVEIATHDTSIRPMKPLKLNIRNRGVANKTVSVKVLNLQRSGSEDTASEDTEIELRAINVDCPAGTLLGEPDFDRKTEGAQNSVILEPRGSATARVEVEARAEDFTSASPKVPVRCTIRFEAIGVDNTGVDSTGFDDTDPTTNNSATLELDVTDRSDPNLVNGAEIVVRPIKPRRVKLSSQGLPIQDKLKVKLENRGTAATDVDWEILTGGCREGSVMSTTGETTGQLILEPREKVQLELVFHAASGDYPEASRYAPARCHVSFAANAAEDMDQTNNTAATFIDIYSR